MINYQVMTALENQSVSVKWLKRLIVQIEKKDNLSYSILKISCYCNSTGLREEKDDQKIGGTTRIYAILSSAQGYSRESCLISHEAKFSWSDSLSLLRSLNYPIPEWCFFLRGNLVHAVLVMSHKVGAVTAPRRTAPDVWLRLAKAR